MSILLDKFKAAKQLQVDIDKYRFSIRRPTDWEMKDFLSRRPVLPDNATDEQKAAHDQGVNAWFREFIPASWDYIEGWNLTELDLYSGGSSMPAPFEPELFRLWIYDQPALWDKLASDVCGSYINHVNGRSEAEKKTNNG